MLPKRAITIAVDIDDTMTFDRIDGEHKRYPGSKVNPAMLEMVNKLSDEGHEIIVWSGDTHYARAFCGTHRIRAHHVHSKPTIALDDGAGLDFPVFTADEFLSMSDKDRKALLSSFRLRW